MAVNHGRISFQSVILLCGLASTLGFLGGLLWSQEECLWSRIMILLARNPEHCSSLETTPMSPKTVPVFLDSISPPTLFDTSLQQQQQQPQPQPSYTEFLVHPSLLVHPNPQHVAIWTRDWDSVQGILEQVRKHPSVAEVSLFVIEDYYSSDAPKTCMADMADWTNAEQGRRCDVQVYSLNHTEELQERKPSHTVDVLLLEHVSLEPTMEHVQLWEQLLRLDQGILLVALPIMNAMQRVAWMDRVLGQRTMFEQITDYLVPVTASDRIHQHFAVAFVHRSTYAHWHLNEANFAVRLRQRHISVMGTPTSDNSDTLVSLDSATMASLRFPSRISENAFCAYSPGRCGAHHPVGINLHAANIPRSQLEVKRSGVGDKAGRGVFSKVDIPANSYLDLESASHPIRVPWKSSKIVWDLVEQNDYFDERASPLHYYFEGYGFADEFWGLQEEVVDSSLLAFINHGCNSTYNIGLLMRQNEFDVDPDNPPEEMAAMYHFQREASYHPRQERNKMIEQIASITCKPIQAGEELLENYLTFGGVAHFKTQVLELREQCMGAVGIIERYQEASRTIQEPTTGVTNNVE